MYGTARGVERRQLERLETGWNAMEEDALQSVPDVTRCSCHLWILASLSLVNTNPRGHARLTLTRKANHLWAESLEQQPFRGKDPASEEPFHKACEDLLISPVAFGRWQFDKDGPGVLETSMVIWVYYLAIGSRFQKRFWYTIGQIDG